MSIQVLKRRFTVDEFHRMVQSGILREDDRVELIHGEVVQMPPIGNDHAACTDVLNRRCTRIPEGRVQVRIQGPIELGEHEGPQPDVTLLRPRADSYRKKAPTPGDVFLAIEVADTTLQYDREVKVPLYASAGIPEAWVVDIAGECVEAYRKPGRKGYREVKRYLRGDSLSPKAFPDLLIAVDEVLGS